MADLAHMCHLLFLLLRPPCPTLFTYTTLFRSRSGYISDDEMPLYYYASDAVVFPYASFYTGGSGPLMKGACTYGRDRKSTRLNSSHANISYAVFCLKKKKQ